MTQTTEVSLRLESAVIALLAAKGVVGEGAADIAKAVVDRCAAMPQYRPREVRSAPATMLSRRAREEFVQQQAAAFLADIRSFIDELVGFLIGVVVETEVERLTARKESQT